MKRSIRITFDFTHSPLVHDCLTNVAKCFYDAVPNDLWDMFSFLDIKEEGLGKDTKFSVLMTVGNNDKKHTYDKLKRLSVIIKSFIDGYIAAYYVVSSRGKTKREKP